MCGGKDAENLGGGGGTYREEHRVQRLDTYMVVKLIGLYVLHRLKIQK